MNKQPFISRDGWMIVKVQSSKDEYRTLRWGRWEISFLRFSEKQYLITICSLVCLTVCQPVRRSFSKKMVPLTRGCPNYKHTRRTFVPFKIQFKGVPCTGKNLILGFPLNFTAWCSILWHILYDSQKKGEFANLQSIVGGTWWELYKFTKYCNTP